MSLVAITGGRGILGQRLRERLGELNIDTLIFGGDITRIEEVEEFISDTRITHVLHLAALVDLSMLKDRHYDFFNVNVSGTSNLMSAIANTGRHPWVFYASSSHVYAPSRIPIREDNQIGPRNIYGLTKLFGERVVTYHSENASANVCIGRIFSLYDERQQGGYLLPATRNRLDRAQSSEKVLIENGEAVRDFSHANEVSNIIIDLMRVQAKGVFNIASGRPSTVFEFICRSFPHFDRFASTGVGSGDIITADVAKIRMCLPL